MSCQLGNNACIFIASHNMDMVPAMLIVITDIIKDIFDYNFAKIKTESSQRCSFFTYMTYVHNNIYIALLHLDRSASRKRKVK